LRGITEQRRTGREPTDLDHGEGDELERADDEEEDAEDVLVAADELGPGEAHPRLQLVR